MNYRGGEFVNNKMKKYLKSIGVKFHLSLSDNKCSIIEIAQKNIQRRIYSYLVANETLQYINILPHICYAYNHSYHRGILMTPAEATEEANQQNLLTTNLNKFHRLKKLKIKPKFKIGDMVRVSLDKTKMISSRSYNLQNSYAKYEIRKISVNNSVEPKYFLKHVQSDILIEGGWFYEHQLTLCTNDTFRGNVIKSRKRKGKTEYLFHYKGYPDEFDEWKTKDEISSISNQ